MHRDFIVYKGKAVSNYQKDGDHYYLISHSEESIKDGYEPVKSENQREISYRKAISKSEIEKKYRVTDIALIDGRECSIFQSSDQNFDQPNSWITIYTDDVAFLKKNEIWEEAELVEDKDGHCFYHSSRIPISEVKILRRRENLPIKEVNDGRI